MSFLIYYFLIIRILNLIDAKNSLIIDVQETKYDIKRILVIINTYKAK